jgi:hypothetical protein
MWEPLLFAARRATVLLLASSPLPIVPSVRLQGTGRSPLIPCELQVLQLLVGRRTNGEIVAEQHIRMFHSFKIRSARRNGTSGIL